MKNINEQKKENIIYMTFPLSDHKKRNLLRPTKDF